MGHGGGRILIALVDVDVLAVDEPLEDLLAGLGRLIVGRYFPGQGAIFVQVIRLDRRFEYPRNFCAHSKNPSLEILPERNLFQVADQWRESVSGFSLHNLHTFSTPSSPSANRWQAAAGQSDAPAPGDTGASALSRYCGRGG